MILPLLGTAPRSLLLLGTRRDRLHLGAPLLRQAPRFLLGAPRRLGAACFLISSSRLNAPRFRLGAARFLVGGFIVPVLLVSTMLALTCITVAFLLLATDRVRRDLHDLASRDPLSGLLNRRGFHELADPLLALSARRDAPVALAVIDLDDFRRLNEQGGHALGDHAIARVGARLLAESRAEDVVARFGGEEFVVLMPLTDGEGAGRFAERLRLAVAAELAGLASMPSGLTASIGLVAARGPVEFNAMYRRADEALYRAKAEGKNRVVIA